MYSSFIVRIFVGAGNAFTLAYKGSVLKRLVEALKGFISYLTKGSVFISIFTKSFNFIEYSIFYRVFSNILSFVTNIFKKFNSLTKKVGEESIIYNSLNKLFNNNAALIRTLAVFVLFFAVGIVGNNLIRGAFSGRSYIVSFALIVTTIIVIAFGGNLEKLLDNSFVYRFIKDLFIIDEGGDQWW